MDKQHEVITQERNDSRDSNGKPLLVIPAGIADYQGLLEMNGIAYTSDENFLRVGVPENVKGWIFHLSVIKVQFLKLFEIVYPFLAEHKLPYKIPSDDITKDQLVDGALGYERLGKVITIYIDNDRAALQLARQLITLTASFKGPAVPTDIHLGAVVYVRYGGFRTEMLVDANGKVENYMHGKSGERIKDPYNIPFVLPKGVYWPFSELAKPVATKIRRIFKGKYLPYIFIKPDVKGRVIKGINISQWFNPRWCIIKEGKMGMCSDDGGRDMIDRINWQFELHTDLSDELPLPRIIDHFYSNNDSYLVMEFIDGVTLDVIQSLLYGGNSWQGVSEAVKLKSIDYLLQIISVLILLHSKGYIHRDVTVANFLVDRKGKVFLIDMELAYNINKAKPDPAFRLGTPGSMSPEQANSAAPTFEQDVYSLGALLVVSFTGFRPSTFDVEDSTSLYRNMLFFTGHKRLAATIANCLSIDPKLRPSLSEINKVMTDFKSDLTLRDPILLTDDVTDYEVFINGALKGLSNPLMLTAEGGWSSVYAEAERNVGNRRSQRAYYMGIREGISGPLYLLALAGRMGFNIDSCLEVIEKNWRYLQQHFLNILPELPPGLYNGAGGIAMAISKLFAAGILTADKEHLAYLKGCLNKSPVSCDIASGAAGQGIALLHSMPYLEKDFVNGCFDTYIQFILSNQLRDGSWLSASCDIEEKKEKMTGLSCGTAGIVWFLLNWHHRFGNNVVLDAALKGLKWLENQAKKEDGEIFWYKSKENKDIEFTLEDGFYGVAMIFIKAYEVTGDLAFRKIAERTLSVFPSKGILPELAVSNGMAGLGEVYLEAYRVFREEIWRERATWVAEVLLHTVYYHKDGNYWLINSPKLPNADLLAGNSGLIYFLMHYLRPDEMGFILLPQ
ncbi:MAG: protein kinase [Chitinophaga sp.]|uniref:lanthionine synthetase LanC family protein n=1 Tax=Chitinophaga sp. TaxID=1869181 RepID=UPI001B174311|nr:lanthionine synthetase LanC family protein [Chitinophaga sp.]MBO9730197.1 protein kinase [Chitinophaga sp.]